LLSIMKFFRYLSHSRWILGYSDVVASQLLY
jgi:muramoyltetrapeptide carboxypeptidase LdcA involved in peptidoglycan recycling